jgi:hypothetical protein
MKSLLLLFFIAVIISGCASESKIHGPISEREVAVKTNKNEFSPGDRVSIYEEKCEDRTRGGGEKMGGTRRVCRDIKVGAGEIVKRISEKEVILRADQNVVLREGFEVKKE